MQSYTALVVLLVNARPVDFIIKQILCGEANFSSIRLM